MLPSIEVLTQENNFYGSQLKEMRTGRGLTEIQLDKKMKVHCNNNKKMNKQRESSKQQDSGNENCKDTTSNNNNNIYETKITRGT